MYIEEVKKAHGDLNYFESNTIKICALSFGRAIKEILSEQGIELIRYEPKDIKYFSEIELVLLVRDIIHPTMGIVVQGMIKSIELWEKSIIDKLISQLDIELKKV